MATIVTEDGILIAPETLERFSFKTFEKGVVDFGTQEYPLNLYGNTGNKEK
jgi:hypothetical protein